MEYITRTTERANFCDPNLYKQLKDDGQARRRQYAAEHA
jgi:hypothetical protein